MILASCSAAHVNSSDELQRRARGGTLTTVRWRRPSRLPRWLPWMSAVSTIAAAPSHRATRATRRDGPAVDCTTYIAGVGDLTERSDTVDGHALADNLGERTVHTCGSPADALDGLGQ